MEAPLLVVWSRILDPRQSISPCEANKTGAVAPIDRAGMAPEQSPDGVRPMFRHGLREHTVQRTVHGRTAMWGFR